MIMNNLFKKLNEESSLPINMSLEKVENQFYEAWDGIMNSWREIESDSVELEKLESDISDLQAFLHAIKGEKMDTASIKFAKACNFDVLFNESTVSLQSYIDAPESEETREQIQNTIETGIEALLYGTDSTVNLHAEGEADKKGILAKAWEMVKKMFAAIAEWLGKVFSQKKRFEAAADKYLEIFKEGKVDWAAFEKEEANTYPAAMVIPKLDAQGDALINSVADKIKSVDVSRIGENVFEAEKVLGNISKEMAALGYDVDYGSLKVSKSEKDKTEKKTFKEHGYSSSNVPQIVAKVKTNVAQLGKIEVAVKKMNVTCEAFIKNIKIDKAEGFQKTVSTAQKIASFGSAISKAVAGEKISAIKTALDVGKAAAKKSAGDKKADDDKKE
jgi:hypothetical protein